MIDWTPNAIALQIGPLSLFWYGIAYAVGLALAYWVMTRQARAFGEKAEIIGNGLIIVAIAALIGGRLYHVIDQWQLYKDDLLKIVLPPYSGLGIFGGFVTGTVAVLVLVRHYKVSAWRWADIIAPGIFVMQAAGRWGNFFNQELYGPPTNLPWGIAIDCVHRVVEYPCTTFPLATTHFHPLFLYESISAMIGAATLVWLSQRPRPWLRVGDLGAIMLIWIGGVRFMIEFLRIGNWRIGDIPTAQYFGAAFVV
ncbi:MAG: phosphatidylglycerol---prolipoprotein diacylglyceryl transferase, partial [Chloroflexota bacterium]|nr:phosphatidylglycerol---prolipoprotein diacylglyceryl transferase [Chloroflexota bacterium]